MSVFRFFSSIILFSMLSCSGSSTDNHSQQLDNQEDLETINYELKDSSIMKVPYNGITKVVFVDSLSNKLTFTIQENELKTECLSNYNKELKKCEPPSWTEQSKEFKLINDSLDLTFIVQLKTEPDHSGSHPKKFSDKLFLWTVNYPDKVNKESDTKKILESRHALFQCIVDQRTSTYSSHWTPADSSVILGRTFYNVLGEGNNGSENDHSILFNFEYGIISFQDYQSNNWRFSHFPE